MNNKNYYNKYQLIRNSFIFFYVQKFNYTHSLILLKKKKNYVNELIFDYHFSFAVQ